MENIDINTYSKSDLYFIDIIGEFVKSTRISQNKTQQELADAAGLNRTTLSQLERGKSVTLLSLIQVLRAIKKLDVLSTMEIRPQFSPMQLAALEQKQSKRVSKKKLPPKPKKSDW